MKHRDKVKTRANTDVGHTGRLSAPTESTQKAVRLCLAVFTRRENPGVDGAVCRLPVGSPIAFCSRPRRAELLFAQQNRVLRTGANRVTPAVFCPKRPLVDSPRGRVVRETQSLVMSRERSSLVARGTVGPAHSPTSPSSVRPRGSCPVPPVHPTEATRPPPCRDNLGIPTRLSRGIPCKIGEDTDTKQRGISESYHGIGVTGVWHTLRSSVYKQKFPTLRPFGGEGKPRRRRATPDCQRASLSPFTPRRMSRAPSSKTESVC